MDFDKIYKLSRDIDSLIREEDPETGETITVDTILKSNYNKSLLRDIKELIDQIFFSSYSLNKRKKRFFYVPEEKRQQITISEKPIFVSALIDSLNEHIEESMKKVKVSDITNWLVHTGYLREEVSGEKTFKTLTEKSSTIGLLKESRVAASGESYDVILYSTRAQRFVVDHLREISEFIIESTYHRKL